MLKVGKIRINLKILGNARLSIVIKYTHLHLSIVSIYLQSHLIIYVDIHLYVTPTTHTHTLFAINWWSKSIENTNSNLHAIYSNYRS